MRKRFWTCVAAGALAWMAPALRADVWDLGADNDNDNGSKNEFVHGLSQVHDLAAQAGGTVEDADYYYFAPPCNASFEIVIDGLTGDVGNGTSSPALELLDSDGTTLLLDSTPLTSLGVARRLALYCATTSAPAPPLVSYVRVSQPGCALSCTANDRYRIRMYDTTALVPRYNNANGQVTVLVIQSSSAVPASVFVVPYDASGVALGFFPIGLAPNQVQTVNLATVLGGFLGNKGGALKILSDAPYGALAGKAVAVEPATGFTFDTPLVYQVH